MRIFFASILASWIHLHQSNDFSTRGRGRGWGSSPEFYGTKAWPECSLRATSEWFHQVRVVHCAKIYYHCSGNQTGIIFFHPVWRQDFPFKTCQQKDLNISFILCCPTINREREKINTDYELNQKKEKTEMGSNYRTFHWILFSPLIYCVLMY